MSEEKKTPPQRFFLACSRLQKTIYKNVRGFKAPYTDLPFLIERTNEVLSKFGFAVFQRTIVTRDYHHIVITEAIDLLAEDPDKMIFRRTKLTPPLPTPENNPPTHAKDIFNANQCLSSSLTYVSRKGICILLNICPKGEDTDGEIRRRITAERKNQERKI